MFILLYVCTRFTAIEYIMNKNVLKAMKKTFYISRVSKSEIAGLIPKL